jgi:chaperone modulatory protein CbpM
MTAYFTPEQAIAAVPGLSQARLKAFLDADLVAQTHPTQGPVFRASDLARLELLCDLADHFDLEGDALGVVIGLIDQLHTARQRLHAMAQAMEAEPQDLRARVGARFVTILAM